MEFEIFTAVRMVWVSELRHWLTALWVTLLRLSSTYVDDT
jgi:hypothetical protein